MTSSAWAMMLGIGMQALVFHAMPRFSQPDILFAVTCQKRSHRAAAARSSRGIERSSGPGPRRRLLSAC